MNIRPQMITERQAAEPSYSKWQPTPQALADMRKRYGDAQGFLSIFTPDLQIADISDRLGFGSPRYFTRCFKAQFEITPAEYRKKTVI